MCAGLTGPGRCPKVRAVQRPEGWGPLLVTAWESSRGQSGLGSGGGRLMMDTGLV